MDRRGAGGRPVIILRNVIIIVSAGMGAYGAHALGGNDAMGLWFAWLAIFFAARGALAVDE